jgi:hypothetical protein
MSCDPYGASQPRYLDHNAHLPRGDDLVTEMQARNNRDGGNPTISQSARYVTPDLPAAPLNERDVIPRHGIEARNNVGKTIGDIFKTVLSILI